MESVDKQYADLIRDCLENGDCIQTRNSKVKRVVGSKLVFQSTPLISVRKTAWKLALREWEFFMSGSSNIKDLHPSVRHWWEPWAEPNGELKYNYSQQFRGFSGVNECDRGEAHDQIGEFVKGVQNHPYSRRNLVTTWNPYEMTRRDCKITNCHSTVIQAFVTESGLLDLVTYQRSCDVVCGLPHNLIQMAAFHLWLAGQCGRSFGKLVWIGGDVHVYSQHFELAEKIIQNVDRCKPTPTLQHFSKVGEDFKADNFELDGEYEPILTDRAEMVV